MAPSDQPLLLVLPQQEQQIGSTLLCLMPQPVLTAMAMLMCSL